jgi:hypothetical protein
MNADLGHWVQQHLPAGTFGKVFVDVLTSYRCLFPEQQIPPSEQQVRNLEVEVGMTLPSEYRSFLLEFGSIGPEIPTEVPLPQLGSGQRFAVCYFLGFYRPEPNPNLLRFDLNHVYRAMRHRIGPSRLPIATGEGGSLLCLSLSPEDQRGQIWAWSCDLNGEDGWNIYPLADSLAKLMCSVQPFVDASTDNADDDE